MWFSKQVVLDLNRRFSKDDIRMATGTGTGTGLHQSPGNREQTREMPSLPARGPRRGSARTRRKGSSRFRPLEDSREPSENQGENCHGPSLHSGPCSKGTRSELDLTHAPRVRGSLVPSGRDQTRPKGPPAAEDRHVRRSTCVVEYCSALRRRPCRVQPHGWTQRTEAGIKQAGRRKKKHDLTYRGPWRLGVERRGQERAEQVERRQSQARSCGFAGRCLVSRPALQWSQRRAGRWLFAESRRPGSDHTREVTP